MNSRPWRLSGSDLKALRCLEVLADSTKTWLKDVPVEGVARDDMWAFLRDVQGRGWVEIAPERTRSLAQTHPGARITSRGESHFHVAIQKRDDVVARAKACRTEFLLWLYSRGDAIPVLSDFHEQATAPAFYGDPFSEADATAAARHLKDDGLINGQVSFQSNGAPLRPRLTAKGRRCVEDYDADPSRMHQAHSHAPAATIHATPAASTTSTLSSSHGSTAPGTTGDTYIQNNYNSAGSIAQGTHAQAVTHQGMSVQDVEALLAVFARSLDEFINPHDREEFQDTLDDLRSDLTSEVVEPARVERRLRTLNRITDRVGSAVLTAGTSEGTRRIVEWLATLT